MSGVAIVDENDRLFWVDRSVLRDILDSAIEYEDDLAYQIKEHPRVWEEEGPEVLAKSEATRAAAVSVIEFLEGSK